MWSIWAQYMGKSGSNHTLKHPPTPDHFPPFILLSLLLIYACQPVASTVYTRERDYDELQSHIWWRQVIDENNVPLVCLVY